MRPWTALAVTLPVVASLGVLVLGACGTDAQGIETCRQIEEARCKRAPTCGVDLSIPVHRDSPKTDIDACIRWYHDACLHGLEVSDPGTPATQACVKAITTSASCDVVVHPESDPACAWLVPAPASDAGSDAPADAPPDGAAGASDGAAD